MLLRDADAVLALTPGYSERDIGVVGSPRGSPAAIEVRAFFPKDGVTTEDPVTGSLNAALAEWLVRSGRLTAPYVASQGGVLGREGRVHISQDSDGSLWVGGRSVACVEGTVEIWRGRSRRPIATARARSAADEISATATSDAGLGRPRNAQRRAERHEGDAEVCGT